MDPMTQSAQISSSQGLADGQNSAAKESKLSDSFLSSSPVSLIQSPQDKRVGSDKPCEGVATSLRFPSQPGSFTPGNYGSEAGPPDGQPDSPIKTSPVSERIKALEALAAKKKEPDFRSDGGFSHFRDRHHEKSPAETPKSPTETPKSPAETPKSPAETPKSPAETPKSPAETPKSPAETPKSPAETPKSPAETPKSPTETPKSPTETPKSPIKTPKSPTEKIMPSVQKRGGSADQESPESPFEVLGDLRQTNEFEETEEWMKAHLPPVPDFDAVNLIKGTLTSDSVKSKEEKETGVVIPDVPAAFAGVPDAFMDTPAQAPKHEDELSDAQKQTSVEEESEFDLSFLPTAYMWDRQEKSSAQAPLSLDIMLPASPAPPAGFDSPSPPASPPVGTDAKHVSEDKKTMWTEDLQPPEASEADSSGESDDTVIEDSVPVPASVPPSSSDPAISNDPTPASAAPSLPTEEKETPPPKSERKLMQVPTINVIETDEPNYSDEEMEMELEVEEDEDYKAVKDLAREAPKTPEPEDSKNEPPITRPLETEFMEGYSPPSSPVDSDAEYSPKHNTLKSLPETVHQECASKPEALPNQALSEKSQNTSNKVNDEPSPLIVTNEEVDFQDNDDEWSDEAQHVLVQPCKTDLALMETTPYTQSNMDEKSSSAAKEAYMETASLSKTSFMQDDIYDRQSFDYDYDASSPLDDIDDKGLNNAKERFLSDPSQILIEPLNASGQNQEDLTSVNDDEAFTKPVGQPTIREYPQDPYSSFQSETLSSTIEQDSNKTMTTDMVTDNMSNGNSLPAQKFDSKIQQDIKADYHAPDTTSDPDSSLSESTDSFVEFMRECLKSRQDEEPYDTHQAVPSKNKVCKTDLPPSQSTPTMVMDLEQEQLTINALKELGSSQEEEEDEEAYLQSKVLDQGKTNPNATSKPQSSFTSVPNPPCSQSHRVFDSTYSKEVEAIDEWVAEAYHLAEHVLTAIITHLSVKDLIHWRDPKKSGLVFGLSMLLLLSLAAFSVISVASYLLLALLCVTITFRIYKSVVQAVQKSGEGHPFKTLIDKDVSVAPETFRKHVDASLTYINRALKQMSRLFLVEDLVDSLKLAVVMWLFTYVGAVFNGITILILADILLFAVPPVYEKYKTQIDQYMDLIRTQVNTTMAKLQEKLPGAVKRSKTE
ncbi:reticulon-3 isoform X1 [Sander lucioperca]|uniref:reticulon-3 isoform X1 n=1 Tax=Sander lucioperca TaxID=283035 RepID=UPI00125DB0F3|nr:reticulon-3 isoform X1 [Sander lucioperca]